MKAACLTVLLSAIAATSAAQDRTVLAPIVTTPLGQVQGKIAGGVEAYFGIPYAAPPAGALRWQPPQPAAAWSGVRPATDYGAACPQPYGIDSPRTETEDCLFINLQRPLGTTPADRLPVYVYIYGGGFVGGSGNNENLDKLVRDNRIVGVTMNYRLGALGFLALAGLAGPGGQAGNYGLQDQQAALRWVHDTVAAFGGDPAEVTIGGESAGGRSVLAHLVAPGSRGLFAGAIVQSGSDSTLSRSAAEAAGADFASQLGCTGPDAAACLRAKPVAALIDAASPPHQLTGDTAVLPQAPYPAFLAGQFAAVPVLIGGQRDEWRALMTHWFTRSVPQYDQAGYDTFVRSQFPRAADAVLDVYPWPDDATRFSGTYRVAQLRSDGAGIDGVGACSTHHLAEAIAAHVPTYRYEFDHSDGPGWFDIPGYLWGAGHAAELAYLIPNRGNAATNDGRAFNPAEGRLSDEMVSAWGQFVRTGNPAVEGQPDWPRYQPGGAGSVLSLQAGGASHTLPVAAITASHNCAFWDSLHAQGVSGVLAPP